MTPPLHCFIRYSRGRYLAQRTGVDLRGKSPQRVAQHLFECPKEELAAMRSGAFFVVCDEFSKTSAIFRMLTETNIAMPVEQFFGAEDFASLADGQGALDAAVRTYVTEERMSQEYQANRDKLVARLRPNCVPVSARRALLTPQVNPGSFFRRGKRF